MMNLRHLLMVGFFGVAAWLAFFVDKTPEPDLLMASQARTQIASGNANKPVSPRLQQAAPATSPLSILRLHERPTYVPMRGETVGERALFGASSWDPAPPKPIVAPPQPPQAPVLPYTYLGKKFEDGIWEVYLAAGESIRVVRPNTTLDGIYRIGKITPPVLSLTYLPLTQVQTISIGNLE